ncbi:GNAT family N-acetyltransferase [Streptomyces bambusae]|uniref:GNAT family N-acetyltransferase n=1 Tax=Streptomyces bambusae TaxID=1550616 RepID=UPI001CFF80B8|nr:GNAT family N-acetyltransferase [Streptomyces bambusae]MCB5169245.1 GNAT family N-acetyltransferase [Streptomyces bambusae]
MRTDVTLHPLDEARLRALLAAAVADADPREVMPPVDGPPGWTQARQDAFLAFHRSRALAAEPVEVTYTIDVGGVVSGAARLCPLDEPLGTVEAGVWIGRSQRGAGVGGAVLQRMIGLARTAGFGALHISTKPENTAVLRLLDGLGAVAVREGDSVTSWIDLVEDTSTDVLVDVAEGPRS